MNAIHELGQLLISVLSGNSFIIQKRALFEWLTIPVVNRVNEGLQETL
jgi:hypothetical protein